jgi:vacuolar-type H+-ATPase subunit I/STV1
MIDFEAAIYDESAVVRSELDLDTAREKLRQYDIAIGQMEDESKRHEITDTASAEKAVAMAGQVKAILKRIDSVRKQIVGPANEFVKAVNAFAKQYTSRLETIESETVSKVNRWQVEQRRIQMEAQRKAAEEARKIQEELNKKAVEANVEPVRVMAPVIPEKAVTRTESGSASLRKVWKWNLTDFSAVPDEYKSINTVAINQAVKNGLRVIPGVEIYEESETVIRSAAVPTGDMKF